MHLEATIRILRDREDNIWAQANEQYCAADERAKRELEDRYAKLAKDWRESESHRKSLEIELAAWRDNGMRVDEDARCGPIEQATRSAQRYRAQYNEIQDENNNLQAQLSIVKQELSNERQKTNMQADQNWALRAQLQHSEAVCANLREQLKAETAKKEELWRAHSALTAMYDAAKEKLNRLLEKLGDILPARTTP